MKKIIVGLVSLAITLLPCRTASAYSHANAYGGSTSQAQRMPTVGVQPTPTPMVEPRLGLTGRARYIPPHTERPPTPLRIIRPPPPPTMGIIRPPP